MTTTPDAVESIEVAAGVSIYARRWVGDESSPATPGFVLVHGLASNARMWDGVAEALADAGHAVLAIDQRGHGLSSKPDDGYDMTTITDDLLAVVDHATATWAGFETIVLAGQSWGGNVVVEFAARFPGRAQSIVAVDGGTITLADNFATWDAAAEALRPPPLIGRARAELDAYMRRAHPDWPEAGIVGSMACFEVRDDDTIAPWLTLDRHLLVLRGLWDHHPADRYPLITDPVLFITADDAAAPVDWRARKVVSLDAAEVGIDRAEVRWIVGDHDLHAQFPVQIADMLRTW